MKRGEAGFTLVEVLVAFAILSMALAGLYQALAGAHRGDARTKTYMQALAFARAHLETVGMEPPPAAGQSSGVYAEGLAWRLSVERAGAGGRKGQAFRVVLEALDKAGKPLLRLETFRLGPRENQRIE